MLNTKRFGRQRGVTMVETAMVLSVAAVLAAMAVPSYTAWQGNARIRATAEAIQSGLNLARLEAITRNASVSFALQPNGNWTVSCATVTAQCPRAIHGRGGAAAGGGVSLRLTSRSNYAVSEQAAVTFDPRGRPDSASTSLRRIDVDAPTTIVPAAQSRELRIVLSGFGQVRMCDPSASGQSPTAC